jgi:stage II sporulation protein D
VTRGTILQAATLGGIVLGSFLLHSCMAGPRYVEPLAVGEVTSAPKLQVGLGKAVRVEGFTIRLRGDYALHGGAGLLDRGAAGDLEVRINGGLTIGRFVSKEPVVRVVPARDGDLEFNGIRYRGEFLIVRDEEKAGGAARVTLVNEVDLESYLKGVVGSEMSLSQHPEALKAQSIAARTYAMYEVKQQTLRRVRGEKFDVWDDDRSQVYLGIKNEAARAIEVVDATRGMFCVWQGRIFKTFFSSTCGGATEPAKMVLGREAEDIPPLNGTTCGTGGVPYCSGSKHFRWSAELSKADIVAKLFPDKPQVKVERVEVTKRLPGGHALEVSLSLAGTARKVVVHANDGFRRKIDARLIRSTLWEEEIQEDATKVVIKGRGWGHGCGLCQVGAYKMAELGFGAVQICEFYYPGAKVQKLY